MSDFAPGTATWLAHLGSLTDTIRQTLVSEQLAPHLPPAPPDRELRALDAGCGQGTQAIELARRGVRVTGVDSGDAMLDAARERTADEPAEVRDRLRFEAGDVLALGDAHRGAYDIVCCHGVAMYLPSLDALCAALAAAARPGTGAIVSLLTRNRAGIAMRAGMTGRWRDAIDGFDATHYTNRLGVQDVRADEPAAVGDALRAAGAEPVAWYGVRLFSDHLPRDAEVDDPEALIAAEAEAGRRDPYRALAALTHTIAVVA